MAKSPAVGNSGVYEIVNRENCKRYIGSSVNLLKRWRMHLWRLRNNSHHSATLQSAYNKYGEVFTFNVLELCAREVLYTIEQAYIDKLSPEYNINLFTQAAPSSYAQRNAIRKGEAPGGVSWGAWIRQELVSQTVEQVCQEYAMLRNKPLRWARNHLRLAVTVHG